MMSLQSGQPQAVEPTPEITKPSSTTPQTPKLNFQYEPIAQNVGGDLPYQMIIGVTTDEAMQGFQLRIVCDAACEFQSADLGKGASFTNRQQIDDKTIEVGFNQEFNSNQKGKIVLRGATPFRISAIDKR